MTVRAVLQAHLVLTEATARLVRPVATDPTALPDHPALTVRAVPQARHASTEATVRLVRPVATGPTVLPDHPAVTVRAVLQDRRASTEATARLVRPAATDLVALRARPVATDPSVHLVPAAPADRSVRPAPAVAARPGANHVLDWLLGAPLAVGTPAPEFSATDQDGKRVTLTSLRGRNVILVFYPADDTAVCTKQLCEFRDSWAAVGSKNAVVFGVNPAQPARHDKFRKKYNLPFPLLFDESQKIARAYNSAFSFAPRRTVYLIGPDGIIRYASRGKPLPTEVLASAA